METRPEELLLHRLIQQVSVLMREAQDPGLVRRLSRDQTELLDLNEYLQITRLGHQVPLALAMVEIRLARIQLTLDQVFILLIEAGPDATWRS